MPNPEYSVHMPLPQETDVFRVSIGYGSDAVNPVAAQALLADGSLRWVLESNLRVSRDPESFHFFPRLRLGAPTEDGILPLDSPANKAAKYISLIAKQMKEAATDGTLVDMQTKHIRNVAGFLAFYDIGVGIELVPNLVDAIDGIRTYNEIEGITDKTVQAFLREYEENSSNVIRDVVGAHVCRYVRGSQEVGIYVPEFVAKGATHAQKLFTNINNGLTR